MSTIATWCFRHRFIVITAWVAVLLGLGAVGSAVKSDYNTSFTVSGTDSATAQRLLTESVPGQAGDSDTIIWRVDHGTVDAAAVRTRMTGMLQRVAAVPEVAGVDSPYGPQGAAQISPDRRIAYATVHFTKQANDLAKADVRQVMSAAEAARAPGLDVQLGGQAVASAETTSVGATSAVGVLVAAVVLFIAFGSLLATALSVVTAVAGVGAGLMAIAPLTHALTVVSIAPILGALIGLGVGIDYALFIVSRHRHGLLAGLTPQEAAVKAHDTAGRAVLVAGSVVCVALLGIVSLGVTFLNGLAVASALTVVFTVAAAVTLLPALLGVFGMRVLSRRQRRRRGDAALPGPSRAWARWSRTVQRRPAVLAAAAALVMVVLALPLLSLRLGSSDQGNNPSSTTTRRAYDLLAEGFGPGFNGPLLLVAQTGSPADADALRSLAAHLPGTADVASVQTLVTTPGLSVIQVTPGTPPEAKATSDLIDALRDRLIPAAEHGTTLRVSVGGITAIYADFATTVTAKIPLFLLAIVGLSFLLLMLTFRSLLIPATAAVMNLLAAAATFGVMTAFFQWGWGTEAFDLGTAGPIDASMPAVSLAILFGLSMDYQVFLVSRIREQWTRGRDNSQAVRLGQQETARVITAAATIMIFVFLTFTAMGQRDIAEFGVGLATAITLDAFLLRTILVPALMHLFGDANWWLPRRLDRRLPHLAVEPPARASVAAAAASAAPVPSQSQGQGQGQPSVDHVEAAF